MKDIDDLYDMENYDSDEAQGSVMVIRSARHHVNTLYTHIPLIGIFFKH